MEFDDFDFGCMPDSEGFLCAIENMWLSQWVTGQTGSLLSYPIVLSIHGVGMAIVFGVAFVTCLRVLGFARGINISAFDKLFQIGWFGFAINLLSGLILLVADISQFLFQGSFQLKMGLILLGGIMLKLIMNGIRSGKDEAVVKLMAVVCLASWLGAITTGRLMAYL